MDAATEMVPLLRGLERQGPESFLGQDPLRIGPTDADHDLRLAEGLFVSLGRSNRSLPRDLRGWTKLHFKIAKIPTLEVAVLGSNTVPLQSSNCIIWFVRDDWMKWLEQRYGQGERSTLKEKCGSYFLPTPSKNIASEALATSAGAGIQAMYRSAKCLELLCDTLQLLLNNELVSIRSGCEFSLNDSVRLMEARTYIAEQYHKKLTLREIARVCGLNRSKLTKGFRDLFNSTVWEVLTEERLNGAATKLRASDKSIAKIGFEAGYTNIASFTRAFTKKFGIPPGSFRENTSFPCQIRD